MRALALAAAIFATLISTLAMAADGPPPADDAAFLAGDFATAERNYNDALSRSSGDVAALAGLARIRLYQERRAEARNLASRALAADPDNALAKRVLAGVAAREISFGPDIYRITIPPRGTKIRFVATDPLPILRVHVNGGKPVYFFIDTGAPDVVLDASFAKELGIQSSPSGQGTFAGGQQAAIARAVLSKIQIGGVRVEHVPATLMPTRGFALKPGVRIDGIIGTGLLQHFLSTIDYVHGTLVLRPRTSSDSFERATHVLVNVPMWLTRDHFIFARAHINDGPEGLFSIDTGLAGGGLQASRATLEASHVVLDESLARTEQGGAGGVRVVPFRAGATLGALTVTNVAGAFTPDGDQFGIFPFRVAGTLSHDFFRQHAVTFDFAAMRLVVD